MGRLLSSDVYDTLNAWLLDQRLRPGDLLNRRQVADQLGVSIAPVREAFQQLEYEGVLESRPRVGTFVRRVEPEDVRGRLMLREAIETQAARLYCGAPIRRNRRRLEELAQPVDSRHFSDREQWQAEIDFHRALVEQADCPLLLKAFDDVMRQNLWFAVNSLLPPITGNEDMQSPRRNHLLLIDALTTDDLHLAALVAFEHCHRRLATAERQPDSPFYRPSNETR